MNKTCLKVVSLLAGLMVFSSTVFAWGSATHAYIDDQLNKKPELLKLNQIYGGMAPDVFNYMFTAPDQQIWLSSATHCESMRVWNAAILPTRKALAYGFVSHNSLWGADYTAHSPGCPAGITANQGYVYYKALELQQKLVGEEQYAPLHALLQARPELEAEILQDIVETGVDILMKRSDHAIGQKVVTSALLRDPGFPLLLARVYAHEFSAQFGMSYWDAVKIITAAELQFRKTMVLYGQALMQDEATATQLISEQIAELANGLFAANGIQLPPGTELMPLIRDAIQGSMGICQDDYAGEISGTITFVRNELKANGVSY